LGIKKTYRWNRRTLTFAHLERWDAPEFRSLTLQFVKVAKIWDSSCSYETEKTHLEEEHIHILRMILNYFDSIGAGIRFGLLDKKMCYEVMAVNIEWYSRWAKAFMLVLKQANTGCGVWGDFGATAGAE
jgi:hypothetical protein